MWGLVTMINLAFACLWAYDGHTVWALLYTGIVCWAIVGLYNEAWDDTQQEGERAMAHPGCPKKPKLGHVKNTSRGMKVKGK